MKIGVPPLLNETPRSLHLSNASEATRGPTSEQEWAKFTNRNTDLEVLRW